MNILRLAYNIICVILSTDKALSPSRMWLAGSTGHVGSCLLIHWNLLCIVPVEKVHTSIWASRIFIIDSVRWLYELAVLGYHPSRCHLLICLSLSLITWEVLWMPHLVCLAGLTRIVVILLERVLIKTSFWYAWSMSSRCWAIWIIMWVLCCSIISSRISLLQSYILLHYVHACSIAWSRLLARIDIIIILNIDIVIHIVHMLLLLILQDFTTLVATLSALLIGFSLRAILLIGNIWQSSFLWIWYLSWLCHTHGILIIVNACLNLWALTVILMKSCHTTWTSVQLLLIYRNSWLIWSLIS